MDLSARFLAFTTYGVQWVLWLLIGLSVISIAMMLERLWHFATYRPHPKLLLREIRGLLETGAALREGKAGAPSVDSLDAASEGAKVGERLRLERNLAFLGTLGSNAPFIGLFGTVLGIIKAFHDLAGNQSGGPAVVMAGISEALVATAVGLMVAIPAVVAFNYFNRRVRTIMTQVDWMAHLALAELKASEGDGLAASSAPLFASAPMSTRALPYWSRRALPIGLVAVSLVIGGVVFQRRTQPTPRSLVSTDPMPPAPVEPKPVVIPRVPPEEQEEPEAPMMSVAAPAAALAAAPTPRVGVTPARPVAAPARPGTVPLRPGAAPARPAAVPARPATTPARPVAAPAQSPAGPTAPSAAKPGVRSWKGKKPKKPAVPGQKPAEAGAASEGATPSLPSPAPESSAPAVP